MSLTENDISIYRNIEMSKSRYIDISEYIGVMFHIETSISTKKNIGTTEMRKIVILITLLLASKFTMQKKNVHTWKLQ